MTAARAPGKIVLSGAYAVLDGAQAIVSAVNRYALADTSRAASFVTAEVRAALAANENAPWFDAEELRADGRKLGLGSSAAILVASLAARALEHSPTLHEAELQKFVFEPALSAHAAAQGGGSGIDVAASTFGGILIAQRTQAGLQLESAALPSGLVLEVWACAKPASTSELVAKVRALRSSDPTTYARWMTAQANASEGAVIALKSNAAEVFVEALCAQFEALSGLGVAAAAPIVTPDIADLAREARSGGAIVIPSGAGGGDIALFAGLASPSAALRQAAERCGITPLSLELGARGVHRASAE